MIFEKDHRSDPRTRRRYALYELGYTLVDFAAPALFVIGSICYFYDSLATTGTWLFLIGSILFGLKPTIRLVRELHLAAIGDFDGIAPEKD